MQKMKSYTTFSDWKKDQSSKNQKLITEVSKVINDIAPELETTVKWGQGCWTEGKNHKFFIHCKPDHIQLGFYIGSRLQDPKKLLQGDGKFVRHIKIFSKKDINEETLINLITQTL
jgi:hypothetical protein